MHTLDNSNVLHCVIKFVGVVAPIYRW